MPLPKIATPTYELELPSTKKTIKYRPFLVKEEKLLVLALESEDNKQISTAIKQVLKSCIQTRGVKVETLPTFDIEFLFLNIRARSVGEEVEITITAPDDGVTPIEITLDITDIKVQETEGHDKQIKLDDSLMMDMKYPSLDQFIKNNFDFDKNSELEQSFELIATCIDKIYNEDEVWAAADCTKKELVEFLEQMNSAQFKQIENFFTTMPKLSHTIEVVNPRTKEKRTVVLEGLQSFFG
jgi:citrate lyase gamma subunit